MASYPGSIPVLGTYTGADHPQVSHNNAPNDEIEAICTELGVNPQVIADTVAPGSTPASVAEYLDMIANIAKTISGKDAWYRSAVPSRVSIHGHGNGETIPINSTYYLRIFGRGVTLSEHAADLIVGIPNFVVDFQSFWVEFLTANPSGVNDYINVAINRSGTGVDSFAIPVGQSGVFRNIALGAFLFPTFAVNQRMTVTFSKNAAASAASGQIGAWGFDGWMVT